MRRIITSLAGAAAALAVSACAYDDYGYGPRGYGPVYGNYAYEGEAWRGPRAPFEGALHGPGIAMLDPWLRETREGREIVTIGFQAAARGFVDEETAHRANIWFRRYADTDNDLCLTDPEIRVALVQASREHGWSRAA